MRQGQIGSESGSESEGVLPVYRGFGSVLNRMFHLGVAWADVEDAIDLTQQAWPTVLHE